MHVWAYPVGGGAPIFVGAATPGESRPDVGAVYGARFTQSGFDLIADGLPPGPYDLAVFPWSDTAGAFLPATVIQIVVR